MVVIVAVCCWRIRDSWILVGAMRGRNGALAREVAARKNWREDRRLGMYVAMLCNAAMEVCTAWGKAIGEFGDAGGMVMRLAIGITPRLRESGRLHGGVL